MQCFINTWLTVIRSCCLSHLLQQFISAESLYQLQFKSFISFLRFRYSGLRLYSPIPSLYMHITSHCTGHHFIAIGRLASSPAIPLCISLMILLQLIQGCHHGIHWCLLPVLESLDNPVQGLGHVVRDTQVTMVQTQTLQPPPSNPRVSLLVDVLEVVLPEWITPYLLPFTGLPLIILLAQLTE